MPSDTSSNIDTRVGTTSFSISDVQQPPFNGDPLQQQGPEAGPVPGSSFNAGTSPKELLADESDTCLVPNQDNPHSKTRVRRGSPLPDYCPPSLVLEAGLIEVPEEPEVGQNAGDGVPSGARQVPRKRPQRFNPLNMPTFEYGETIENPCIGYTIAKNPVCDSGYYGPTINLAECRLCTFIDYSFLGFFGFVDFMNLRTRIHIYIFIIFIPSQGLPFRVVFPMPKSFGAVSL